MITVPDRVLDRYRAFSLFDSPYAAHDDGSAIDLYPEAGAPSPVAGEVIASERVRAPSRPYAPDHDWLLAIDTGGTAGGPTYRTETGEPAIARILHVDPAVDVGDTVAVGDALGTTIRAGFFAPWVDDHLHLGFRRPGDDLLRATGSLAIAPGVHVEPVEWDGTGTIVETGATDAVLDRPHHPAPGPDGRFAAIAAAVERSDDETSERWPLDGGLPHYERGGLLGAPTSAPDAPASVGLLGATIGTAIGRSVDWERPTVTVDGTPIEGLSLAAARDDLGAKLICPDLELSVGTTVHVRIE